MGKEGYAHCGMFTEQWRNPPAAFNPDARPYAQRLCEETSKALEAEGAYENFTLAERQALNLWNKMYSLLRIPHEEKFRNLK